MNESSLSKSASKHHRLTQLLRQRFRSQYRDGERLPPIEALAREYRVSEPTLRTALLTLAHEGLIEVQQGRGTFMRSRARDRHVAILVDLDLSHPTFSYYWRRLAIQLRRVLKAEGFAARVYLGDNAPNSGAQEVTCEEFHEAIATDQLSGVALLTGPRSPAWVEPLKARGAPIVATMPGFDHYVMSDQIGMVRGAVRRLVAAGRRKIAFMRWAQRGPLPAPPDRELVAFREALAQKGAPYHEQWVRGDIHPNLPGSGWEEFREIWSAGPGHPDALLVTDDVLFQSAIPAIWEAGIRVPEDLLIVAHATKGSQVNYPFPVWLMEVDPDKVAQAMGTMLVQLLRGETVPTPQVIVPVGWTDSEETAEQQSAINTPNVIGANR